MAQIPEILRNLSKQYRERIEKSKKIAANQIKAAEAAKAAAQPREIKKP